MLESKRVYVTHLDYHTACAAFERVFVRYAQQLPEHCELITIKINLCDYRLAESGATTDPLLLGYLIDLLARKYPAAEVVILENDATSVQAESLFSLLGIRDVAERHGVRLFNVSQGNWVSKPIPNPRIFDTLEVPEILDVSDLFINFAKLKTNALTKVTGCLKNIFAFYRAKRKVIFHGRIDDVLVDMNKVIRPHLCLVDGYIGMEGQGPSFGRPKRCELLVSGVDPVAVDACCARIMGFQPWLVDHIRMCHRAGAGEISYRLDTDIADFDYLNYRFSYGRIEHALRSVLRKRVGVAAG